MKWTDFFQTDKFKSTTPERQKAVVDYYIKTKFGDKLQDATPEQDQEFRSFIYDKYLAKPSLIIEPEGSTDIQGYDPLSVKTELEPSSDISPEAKIELDPDIQTTTASLSGYETIGKGIAAGAVGTVGSMASAVDWLTDSEKAREVSDWADTVQRKLAPEDGKFIFDLGAGIGSQLVFLGPGGLVAKGAKSIAKVSNFLATAFGISAQTALEAGTEAGSTYKDMINKDATPEQASKAASTVFLANIPLNAVTNVFGPIPQFGRTGGLLKKTASGAVSEGVQEGGQYTISQIAKDEDVDIKELAYNSAIGSIVGGGTKAATMVGGSALTKKKVDNTYRDLSEKALTGQPLTQNEQDFVNNPTSDNLIQLEEDGTLERLEERTGEVEVTQEPVQEDLVPERSTEQIEADRVLQDQMEQQGRQEESERQILDATDVPATIGEITEPRQAARRGEEATRKLAEDIELVVDPQEGQYKPGILSFLTSPDSPLKAKYKNIQKVVTDAKDAILKQEKLRALIDQKMTDVYSTLKTKAQAEQFNELLWEGDALEKEFTRQELEELKLSEGVIQAYQKQRSFHKAFRNKIAEYRQQHDLDIGDITGHMPHMFDKWSVIDKESGKTISDQKSLKDAVAWANNNKGRRYLIRAKSMGFDNDFMTVLKDASYWRLKRNLEQSMEMSPAMAQKMLNGVVKGQNSARFLRNAKSRTRDSGWNTEDAKQSLLNYYYHGSRYLAMDPFKRDSYDFYEKTYGKIIGEDAKGEARYVKNYINNVLGNQTSTIEETMNNFMNKLYGISGKEETGRPAVFAMNKLMRLTSLTKLGMANLSVGVVNAMDNLNTFSQVRSKSFAKAIKDAPKPNAETRKILDEVGVDLDMGMEAGGGYSQIHLGKTLLENVGMAPFRIAETFNRRVAAMSGYYDAIADGKDHSEAIRSARDLVDRTQKDYSVAGSSPFLSNPLGKFVGQFKNYPVKQMEFIFDNFKQLAGPEKGKAVMKNIKFWTPMLLVAGLEGSIPMGRFIFDIIGKMTGSDDPVEDLKVELLDKAGDDSYAKMFVLSALQGILSNAGINISRRVGTADIIPERADSLLGPTISSMMQLARAVTEAKSTDRQKLINTIKAIAPGPGKWAEIIQTINNDMKVADNYRGGRMKYRATNLDLLAKGFGFQSSRETTSKAQVKAAQRDVRKASELRQKYINLIGEGLMDVTHGRKSGSKKVAKAIQDAAANGILFTPDAIASEVLRRNLDNKQRKALDLINGNKLLLPENMQLLKDLNYNVFEY